MGETSKDTEPEKDPYLTRLGRVMSYLFKSKTIKKGSFSKLFPKTFEYLKSYVPAKYPDFKGDLPDLNVILYKRSIVKGLIKLGQSGYYRRATNRIVINVDELTNLPESIEVITHLQENPDLLCKYLDTNNNRRALLIHEHQHFLQNQSLLRRLTLRPKIRIPELLKDKKMSERVVAQIKWFLAPSPILGLYLSGLKGMAIGYGIKKGADIALNKLFPKTSFITSKKMLYLFDTSEIEAQLASIVYGLVLGEPLEEFNEEFHETENKLRANIEVLKEEIQEQQAVYQKANPKERAEIEKIITLKREMLWKSERSLKLTPVIIEEAQRIADKVKENLLAEAQEQAT